MGKKQPFKGFYPPKGRSVLFSGGYKKTFRHWSVFFLIWLHFFVVRFVSCSFSPFGVFCCCLSEPFNRRSTFDRPGFL